MNAPKALRYQKLGAKVVQALKNRFFEAWYFDEPADALEKIIALIPKGHIVSWGGSLSLGELSVKERIALEGYEVIDRDKAQDMQERMELSRQALLCDTYLAGCNAISEDGQLVNIDGYGNRVAAMIFGPRQVIILAGMNKIVKTLSDAHVRAQSIAAPANVQRFPDIKTPCNTTGACAECKTADTICNYIVTTRLCKPAGRIKVILVGKDLGL